MSAKQEVEKRVNPKYTGENKISIPTEEELKDMDGLRKRRIGFAVYANTLSLDSVVMALRGTVTMDEVKRWWLVEKWDEEVSIISANYIEPIQRIAKNWLLARFMKMNTAVDEIINMLPASENGIDADAYARGIERLHNTQMVMIDRPTEISRSESDDRSFKGKFGDATTDDLAKTLAAVETALAQTVESEDPNGTESTDGD